MPHALIGDLTVAYDIQGSGPPLLMINGIGAARGAWNLQVRDFEREFQVVTFDNRDVGETGPGCPAVAYPMQQFAHDAAGLLDALGIECAHVVGASMGGAIAQEFAATFPERTRSVTIVCSWPKTDRWMHELMTQWDEVFRQQGRVAWDRTTWLWVFTHRFYADPANLTMLLTTSEKAGHPQSLEAYLRQSDAFKRHDVLDRLPSITAPAHVICGEEDIYTPLRYSIEIANAIPGATLSVIPEAGHGMFWEATATFNQLVSDFIQSVEAGDPFEPSERDVEEEEE